MNRLQREMRLAAALKANQELLSKENVEQITDSVTVEQSVEQNVLIEEEKKLEEVEKPKKTTKKKVKTDDDSVE
jgi:ribonuclease HI